MPSWNACGGPCACHWAHPMSFHSLSPHEMVALLLQMKTWRCREMPRDVQWKRGQVKLQSLPASKLLAPLWKAEALLIYHSGTLHPSFLNAKKHGSQDHTGPSWWGTCIWGHSKWANEVDGVMSCSVLSARMLSLQGVCRMPIWHIQPSFCTLPPRHIFLCKCHVVIICWHT